MKHVAKIENEVIKMEGASDRRVQRTARLICVHLRNGVDSEL